GGFLFVKDFVEQDNLACDFVATQSLEFFEGFDGDYFGGQAVGGSCCASTQGCQHDFLCSVGDQPRIIDEGGGLGSADPVGDGDLLQADFEAELAKFCGNVFGGGAGLERTGGARSDVLGEVDDLAVDDDVLARDGFEGG